MDIISCFEQDQAIYVRTTQQLSVPVIEELFFKMPCIRIQNDCPFIVSSPIMSVKSTDLRFLLGKEISDTIKSVPIAAMLP